MKEQLGNVGYNIDKAVVLDKVLVFPTAYDGGENDVDIGVAKRPGSGSFL